MASNKRTRKGIVVDKPVEEENENEFEEELDISEDSDEDDSDNEPVTLEEDGDDPDNFSEVQVEFNVEFPKETDFHGVKNYIKALIPDPTFNGSELSDIIVGQKKIGHMIKIDGSEEIFGFFTCINMAQHADKQCIRQIKEFIVNKGTDCDKLIQALDKEGTGLLLCERMLNVPYQLILPVYRALFANMEASMEEEKKNKKKRPTYDFDRYIIVTHFQRKAASAKRSDKKTRQGTDDNIEYSKIEDEYFQKVATSQFTYPIARSDGDTRRWTLNGVMSTMGQVLLVENKFIPAVIQSLEEVLEN